MPSSKGIFLAQGSNLCYLCLPALAGRFSATSATWEARDNNYPVPIQYPLLSFLTAIPILENCVRLKTLLGSLTCSSYVV